MLALQQPRPPGRPTNAEEADTGQPGDSIMEQLELFAAQLLPASTLSPVRLPPGRARSVTRCVAIAAARGLQDSQMVEELLSIALSVVEEA